ncbi:MAG: hypothetical protein IMW86_04965 [Hydrogenibacillus sp.]|nr:hypothetical protein [Hydrogenibacillus sp.]
MEITVMVQKATLDPPARVAPEDAVHLVVDLCAQADALRAFFDGVRQVDVDYAAFFPESGGEPMIEARIRSGNGTLRLLFPPALWEVLGALPDVFRLDYACRAAAEDAGKATVRADMPEDVDEARTDEETEVFEAPFFPRYFRRTLRRLVDEAERTTGSAAHVRLGRFIRERFYEHLAEDDEGGVEGK